MNDTSNPGENPSGNEVLTSSPTQEGDEVRGIFEAASREFREAVLESLRAIPPLIAVIVIFRAVAGIHTLIFFLGFICFSSFLFVFVYEGFDFIQNQFDELWEQQPAKRADTDRSLFHRFVEQTRILFQVNSDEISIVEYRRTPIFSYIVSAFWSFWMAIGLYLVMITITGALLEFRVIEMFLGTVGPQEAETWSYISAIASDFFGLMLELLNLSETSLSPRTATTLLLLGFFPGLLFMRLARDVAVISEELHRRLLKHMYLSLYLPIQNEFANLFFIMGFYGILIYLL